MKSILIGAVAVAGLTGFCTPKAHAEDVATVVSVQPRLVTVQQRQCSIQEVVRENDTTGGKIVGGVAGAAIGSTIGGNSRDRLVGGVVGGLLGGAIGNEVAKGPATIEQRQICSYVPVTVQQGRIVTFNYQGMTFTQQFPQ
jgi:uncharacterized protein YcfJ